MTCGAQRKPAFGGLCFRCVVLGAVALADELGEYDDVWMSFERAGRKQGVLLELRRR